MQIHRTARRSSSVHAAIAATVVAAVLALTSCSSDNTASNTADATTTSVETASPPVASAMITEGTGMFGSAVSAACDTDRPNVELALEAYLALNGDIPVAEPDLVTAGLLREESALYDIADGNVIVPSPAGGCTS